MISKATIDKIFDSTNIEEVIGEFVQLKRKQSNYIGLCPFHNEKSPSFYVSPSKGIYKCFGCGEAGNAINFLMNYEKMTYPDALRKLANRYNIAIEETYTGTKEEFEQQRNDQDSLMALTAFAQKQMTKNMLETDEGKSVGLAYLKQRQINPQSIDTFLLGYSLDAKEHLTNTALKNGFAIDYLQKSGLTFISEHTDGNPSTYRADRFRGRIMFPIQDAAGKVVGFGGRTLKIDKKEAKYVNSPESDIYSKSKVLYGLFQAKKAIRIADNCLLTEGYMDVIRLHQIGIENVVASSGTSLTQEQARLIKRFTDNVTVVYDGDSAGIKAAIRGIDILLENDLNVKIVVFPDGEDADSYAQKIDSTAFKTFIETNAQDFIHFKTQTLLKDANNDITKKAEVINEVLLSIAKIAEPIKAALFTTQAAALLQMDEQLLMNQVNKFRFDKAKNDRRFETQKHTASEGQNLIDAQKIGEQTNKLESNKTALEANKSVDQEKKIVRLLLLYGNKMMNNGQTVIDYLVKEFDGIEWEDETFYQIFQYFEKAFKANETIDKNTLMQQKDAVMVKKIIDIMGINLEVSNNWFDMHGVFVKGIDHDISQEVISSADYLKLKKIQKMMRQNQKKMDPQHQLSDEQTDEILQIHMHLKAMEIQITQKKGIVIMR